MNNSQTIRVVLGRTFNKLLNDPFGGGSFNKNKKQNQTKDAHKMLSKPNKSLSLCP
jgi:hypothetical protein